MKILALIFMLLFSVTVLADCCLEHAPDDHQEAHCARTCSPKIIAAQPLIISLVPTHTLVSFPQYINNSETIDPLPLLQPPIL
jgi:hypothetical protein